MYITGADSRSGGGGGGGSEPQLEGGGREKRRRGACQNCYLSMREKVPLSSNTNKSHLSSPRSNRVPQKTDFSFLRTLWFPTARQTLSKLNSGTLISLPLDLPPEQSRNESRLRSLSCVSKRQNKKRREQLCTTNCRGEITTTVWEEERKNFFVVSFRDRVLVYLLKRNCGNCKT